MGRLRSGKSVWRVTALRNRLLLKPALSSPSCSKMRSESNRVQALAISVYCALVARDFRHGVILAVNHDGDSDSTGAIAGNLLGTVHGVGAIPAAWLEPLELRDVIAELAEDLYSFRNWEIGEYRENEPFSQRIWQKYPGY